MEEHRATSLYGHCLWEWNMIMGFEGGRWNLVVPFPLFLLETNYTKTQKPRLQNLFFYLCDICGWQLEAADWNKLCSILVINCPLFSLSTELARVDLWSDVDVSWETWSPQDQTKRCNESSNESTQFKIDTITSADEAYYTVVIMNQCWLTRSTTFSSPTRPQIPHPTSKCLINHF